MSVRAKFKVDELVPSNDGDQPSGTVRMSPVTNGSSENESFYRYTPSGSLSLSTINAAAFAQFKVGDEWYLDLSPAKPPEPTAEAPAPPAA